MTYIGLASLSLLIILLTVNCSYSSSGGRRLSKQEAALNKSMTAMSSLGTAASLSSNSTNVTSSQATDSFCDENGTSTLPSNDSMWAFSKFLCAGAHNTFSSDSALGAFALIKGIICIADQNRISYSASGSVITLNNAVLNKTCFPAEMLAKLANESPAITSVSGLVAGFTLPSSGWDFRLEFRNMSVIGDFDVFIRSSGSVVAAAFVLSGGGDSWTVTVDQRETPNRLVYEAVNTNRHMRLLAEGSMSNAGTLSPVTGIASIVADAASGEYVSLRGNDIDGVRLSFEKSGQPEVLDACFDVADIGATCGSTIPLSFYEGQVTGFTDSSAVTAAEANFATNPILFLMDTFPVTSAPASAFTNDLR